MSARKPPSSESTKDLKEKELLFIVAKTDRYRVNNKHDFKCRVRSPDEIVSKAEMLVGQTVEYKLISKNCEHFANGLRYNVAWSDQVQDWALLAMEVAFSFLLMPLKVQDAALLAMEAAFSFLLLGMHSFGCYGFPIQGPEDVARRTLPWLQLATSSLREFTSSNI